jgi:hypothetical protein
MDREDAAFVADVLDRRIAGAREDLERLAASSFAALLAAAAIIREKAGDWEPALVAAAELSAIAKGGGSVCDRPPPEYLDRFVESMRKLAGEGEPKLNRDARRKLIAGQPRARRLSMKARDLVITGPAPLTLQ